MAKNSFEKLFNIIPFSLKGLRLEDITTEQIINILEEELKNPTSLQKHKSHFHFITTMYSIIAHNVYLQANHDDFKVDNMSNEDM